ASSRQGGACRRRRRRCQRRGADGARRGGRWCRAALQSAAPRLVRRQCGDDRLGRARTAAARLRRSARCGAAPALAARSRCRARPLRRGQGVTRIAVLGAGAWGTALATMLAGAGHAVTLWARDADRAAAIARTGRNDAYLPGVTLDPRLAVVAGPAAGAVADAAMLILAVPAQHLGALLAGLTGGGAVAAGEVPLVVTAKGIERESGLFMDEVAARALPQAPVALLSGPSFAAEVARGLPAAVTLACRDEALGARLARTIARRTFRCYWTDDVRGVALGGALKNVLAIAAGIVTGR